MNSSEIGGFSGNRKHPALDHFLMAQSLMIDWKLILDSKIYGTLESSCHALECAMETLTLPFLTTVAAHMGNCHCKINSDWLEQLSIRCIVITRKGEKKTTVCNKMRAVIRHQTFINSHNLPRTESFDKETTKVYNLNENDKTECSRFILPIKKRGAIAIVDDMEFHLNKSLQSLQSLLHSENQDTVPICSFFAMCQAMGTSGLVTALKDPLIIGQLEHVLVCCASDVDFVEVHFEQSSTIELYSILNDIKKAHDEPLIEYVLSSDGVKEFFRVRKSLHVLKQHYIEDEVRWGCINHTAGHVMRMATVLSALSGREKREDEDHSMIIDNHCIQRAFLLVLQLLRHKFAIMGDADGCDNYVELLTMRENNDLKMKLRNKGETDHNTSADDDVIEIRLGDRNVPIARILSNGNAMPRSQSDLIMHELNESTSSDIDILRQGYAQSTSHDAATGDMFIHSNHGLGTPTNLHEDTARNLPHEIHYTEKPCSSSQPIFPDRQMVAQSGHKLLDRPPPLLKIRTNHSVQNKSKSVPPKRIIERSRGIVKNDIYTCSDELFVHQCTLKIRKSMLTHGNIITSSYACQYRLFPPVPLMQRTSSPRTTHPTWAAIKFFERLQKLGLGEVLVFRSQSIRFQKKSYDEMTEETRVLLRSIGVEEEEYKEALNRKNDMTLRMRQNDREYIEYISKDNHNEVYYQVQEMSE